MIYTGIIWKIIIQPCIFVQPIAANDFTSYLFDTDTSFYATIEESWCVKHCSLWYSTTQRVGDSKWAATQWVTVDSNWRTWLLAEATRAWAGWWQYAKFSPHGITERKRRTASYSWSVLLSYKLLCMWAFSSPLSVPHAVCNHFFKSEEIIQVVALVFIFVGGTFSSCHTCDWYPALYKCMCRACPDGHVV